MNIGSLSTRSQQYALLNEKKKELQTKINSLSRIDEIGESIEESSQEFLVNLRNDAYVICTDIKTRRAKRTYTWIKNSVKNILNPFSFFPVADDCFKVIAIHLSAIDFFFLQRVNRLAKKTVDRNLKPIAESFGYSDSGSFRMAIKKEFHLAIHHRLRPFSRYTVHGQKLPFDRVLLNFHTLSNIKKIKMARVFPFETHTIFNDSSFKIMPALFYPVVSSPYPKQELVDAVVNCGEKNLLKFFLKAFDSSESALMESLIRQKNFKVLRFLIENDPGLIDKPALDGATPLCFACGVTLTKCRNCGRKHLDAETIEWILEAKANPDIGTTGEKERYPLHLAVRGKRSDVVGLLLKFGADRNVTDEKGRTPLLLAKELNFGAVVNCLSRPN